MKASTKKALLWGGLAVGIAGPGLGGYYYFTHRKTVATQLKPGERYEIHIPLMNGVAAPTSSDLAEAKVKAQQTIDAQFPGQGTVVAVTYAADKPDAQHQGTVTIVFDYRGPVVSGDAFMGPLQLAPGAVVYDDGAIPA